MNHTSQNKEIPQELTQTGSEWFEEYIMTLKTHKVMLETDTANDAIKELYKILFEGNEIEMAKMAKDSANHFLTKKAVVDYYRALSERKKLPLKLAFNLSDGNLLVWAVIEDDDEDTEKALILSEAKVNADYNKYHYHISSTIVETFDNITIPPHYVEFK